MLTIGLCEGSGNRVNSLTMVGCFLAALAIWIASLDSISTFAWNQHWKLEPNSAKAPLTHSLWCHSLNIPTH